MKPESIWSRLAVDVVMYSTTQSHVKISVWCSCFMSSIILRIHVVCRSSPKEEPMPLHTSKYSHIILIFRLL